ncbi:MAG: phosphate acyltransferase PlsX [Bacteroidota bacterium]
MKIAIDIMGGDFAPETTVLGAIEAYNHIHGSCRLVLIGDSIRINKLLKDNDFNPELVDIVHSGSVIEMGENPAKAFGKKTDSSIALGFGLLLKNHVQAFCSAGNTGAMMVGSLYTIKQTPGVLRPAISVTLPKISGKDGLILDVGINADCKPDVLYQYAIIGDLYARNVLNIENPRIALLNIGEEEEKGNLLTKASYDLMKGTKDFNFVGNIEGNRMFEEDTADVVVCDGFTGNVVLKQAEGFYNLLKRRNIRDEYFERYNAENYGGTPVLGVNSNVIIGHGNSNVTAIKNMIIHSHDVANAKLSEKIKKAFE